ncbi:hypothetical protein CN645_03920 [Burkholderia sp. IDO3]|nr:hypothetical protein CN645_03920 [Burkholderia sp. IDO3]
MGRYFLWTCRHHDMEVAYVDTNERAARTMPGHLETAGHECDMLIKAVTIESKLRNGRYDVLIVRWANASMPVQEIMRPLASISAHDCRSWQS